MATTKLTRTQSTATNRKKWTFSFWIKTIADVHIFTTSVSGNNASLYKGGGGQLYYTEYNGSDLVTLLTTRRLRDASAWYHIVYVYDSTQATESDRVKLYINGVQETSFTGTIIYPSLNSDSLVGQNSHDFQIGVRQDGAGGYYEGLMAHLHFIDGTAYDADTFGETDATTGIWKPKTAPSVTYGTNGFFLKFENSGAFGTDSSGNANNFTVNGTMTQTIDTPSNVFATFNALQPTSATFSNGNTNVISGSAAWYTAPATLGVTSGKYYWEVKAGTISGINYIQAGVCSESAVSANLNTYHANTTYSYAYHWDGQKYINNSASSFGTAISTGDIIMIALDCDNGFIYAGLNGTWQNSGNPTSGGSGTGAMTTLASNQLWFPTVSAYSSTHNANFGNPAFTISSGNSDGNGYGNFEYSVPSGYYALNTKNLAEFG
jgi:hypothetical protein